MSGSGSRRRPARVFALLAVAALVGTAFASTSGAATRSQSGNKVLGTKNPAKGTPVKIGIISNGKTPTVDQTIETPVAEATAQWINEYGNGLAGRPIDIDICDDHGEASQAADCANQMIRNGVAAVVIGQESQLETIWRTLDTSGIPVLLYGASNPSVVADTDNTFVVTNGRATLLALPAGVAKKTKAKKVSIVAIDVPAATSFFKDPGPSLYQKQGLQLELIPIAAGTADMTPQMQRLASGNPKGVVFIIGNDAFCIAALNGLRTAGFEGSITTIPQCLTDATRTAVPADFLEGIQISATAPIGNPKDPAIKQYYAVLDKYGASSVDKSNIGGVAMFTALGAFDAATQTLKGDVTPASVIAAIKAMPWVVIPGTGGLHFRCNGKADPLQPAVCSNGTNAAKLDSTGNATKYIPVADDQIPA
jgi:branched-chain amino acid transport system substrate-binding protein